MNEAAIVSGQPDRAKGGGGGKSQTSRSKYQTKLKQENVNLQTGTLPALPFEISSFEIWNSFGVWNF
jgi:hypothetical protein